MNRSDCCVVDACQAKRWGGFGRNLLCMLLLIGQLLLLGLVAKYLINHK